jgi:Na+/glutamate symporter
MPNEKPSNNNLLYQYMGFAFQFMAGIGLAVYAGFWLDKWIKPGIPVFIWLLPLAVIIATIVKAVKDTSGK